MNTIQKNRLQVLRRVRDFLKPMAEEAALAAVLVELDGVIDRMTEEGNRQDAHARQAKNGTGHVSALAHELRSDLLRPVLQLVKTVAPDAFASGFPGSESLALPETRDRQGLITAANGVYATAKPYEAKLTAAGLPKEHLARLQAGAIALREAIDERAQSMLKRGAARSSATAESKRAVQLLRLIDTLVVPLLRRDAGKLSAWASAKRMGYRVVGTSVPAGDGVIETGTSVSGVSVTGTGIPAASVLSQHASNASGVAGEVTKAA